MKANTDVNADTNVGQLANLRHDRNEFIKGDRPIFERKLKGMDREKSNVRFNTQKERALKVPVQKMEQSKNIKMENQFYFNPFEKKIDHNSCLSNMAKQTANKLNITKKNVPSETQNDYSFTIKHFPAKQADVFKPFALGRMNFNPFGLDYKMDEFKQLMGFLKNAPLLFMPYFLTAQPAFAGLGDLSADDVATAETAKTTKRAYVTAQELYGQLGAPPGSAAEAVAK